MKLLVPFAPTSRLYLQVNSFKKKTDFFEFIKRLSVYTTVKSFVWLPSILFPQLCHSGMIRMDVYLLTLMEMQKKLSVRTQWTIFGVCAVSFSCIYFYYYSINIMGNAVLDYKVLLRLQYEGLSKAGQIQDKCIKEDFFSDRDCTRKQQMLHLEYTLQVLHKDRILSDKYKFVSCSYIYHSSFANPRFKQEHIFFIQSYLVPKCSMSDVSDTFVVTHCESERVIMFLPVFICLSH